MIRSSTPLFHHFKYEHETEEVIGAANDYHYQRGIWCTFQETSKYIYLFIFFSMQVGDCIECEKI